MIINCVQCGKPTIPRQVQKGPNGPWTAYECHSGCMNGQYKLTTKPPKAPKAPYSEPPPTNGALSESTRVLKQIHTELVGIRQLLNSKITLKNDPLEIVAENEPGEDAPPF